jgi:hypothetical protein
MGVRVPPGVPTLILKGFKHIMSDLPSPMFDDADKKRAARGGIKHRSFTASGTNGASHRANAAKKKAQHLKNMAIRAALYQEMGGERGHQKDWHARLDALSQGTA